AKAVFQTSLASSLGTMAEPIAAVVRTGIQLNIILAVFNMIPVPPLDGSKVLMNLLPDSIAESYAQIPDWSGFIVLFLLMQVGFITALMLPIFRFVDYLLYL
ncbi:MAG: site-2 protease family protein, partial [Acidobacteria bacterium]|nr:site-2 protease family protein [Acidobacteriota bacterium]